MELTIRVPLPCIFLAFPRAKIDKKPELIAGVELLQIHMLRFVKSTYFAPNVPTFDAVVVQHVWRAVDRDADFFRSGKMYFSESLAPAAYGSTNSKRMPFMDLLWALTFMFILVSVPLLIGTTLSRDKWS